MNSTPDTRRNGLLIWGVVNAVCAACWIAIAALNFSRDETLGGVLAVAAAACFAASAVGRLMAYSRERHSA